MTVGLNGIMLLLPPLPTLSYRFILLRTVHQMFFDEAAYAESPLPTP
jgi:hypothetical protein